MDLNNSLPLDNIILEPMEADIKYILINCNYLSSIYLNQSNYNFAAMSSFTVQKDKIR
jgi:hypothetical protein